MSSSPKISDRRCERCGDRLINPGPNKKFCSNKCRSSAYIARENQARKEVNPSDISVYEAVEKRIEEVRENCGGGEFVGEGGPHAAAALMLGKTIDANPHMNSLYRRLIEHLEKFEKAYELPSEENQTVDRLAEMISAAKEQDDRT